MSPKHHRSQAENMARIRALIAELKEALESTAEVQIRDGVLRSGFHPDRAGKVLVGVLLERHRAQHRPPFIVEIGPADVLEVARELGVEPDLIEEEAIHA